MMFVGQLQIPVQLNASAQPAPPEVKAVVLSIGRTQTTDVVAIECVNDSLLEMFPLTMVPARQLFQRN